MPVYAAEPLSEGTPNGVVHHVVGAHLTRWRLWSAAVRHALLSHQAVRVVDEPDSPSTPAPDGQARRSFIMSRLAGDLPPPPAAFAPELVDPDADPLAPGGALDQALAVEVRDEARGREHYCEACNIPFANARAFGQHRRHHHPS